MALLASSANLDQSDRIASRVTPFVLPIINLEPRSLFCYIKKLGYQHPATTSSLLPAVAELVSILAYSSAESSRFYYAAEPFFKLCSITTEWRKTKKKKHTHKSGRKLILGLLFFLCGLSCSHGSGTAEMGILTVEYASNNTLTSWSCTEN